MIWRWILSWFIKPKPWIKKDQDIVLLREDIYSATKLDWPEGDIDW